MGGVGSFPVVPLAEERIVVVTGANTGLGYEIAKWSAMMGATVILACRSEDKTKQAIARMQQEFEVEQSKRKSNVSKKQTLALQFMKCDMGSFKSVVQFCDEFKKSGKQLHVLFCNAGIGLHPFSKTEDDFEEVLQVNYLSHFIMIGKLLPVMKKSGPDCRILLMSSDAYKAASFDLNTMNYSGSPGDYGLWDYYGRSKLYQIMQTYCQARRLKDSNISINSIHPGIVKTEFGRDSESCMFRFFMCCVAPCKRTPLQGATCSIDLTVNPKHGGVTGHYWHDCRIVTPSGVATNVDKQEALWKKTLEYVGKFLTEEEIAGLEGK